MSSIASPSPAMPIAPRLMLNLIGADWKPVFVDFFKGETRTPAYRGEINEMGEAPVLAHGDRKLTQSGVILTYLARRSGKYPAAGRGRRARGAALDHLRQSEGQRLSRALSLPEELRQASGRSGRARLLQGTDRRQSRHRQQAARKQRRSCVGDRPTIADVSLAGYLYYPAEEFGFDIGQDHPAIAAWRERMNALPGWAHPYDLMPGIRSRRKLIGRSAPPSIANLGAGHEGRTSSDNR